jgi:hypothetical protein
MFKSRKTVMGVVGILIFGVVVALGLAALSSHLSLAADSPEETPTPSSTSGGVDRKALASQYSDVFLQALATRLNVSLDTLKQALAGAGSDTLDQAVADGLLTQTEADQIKTAVSDWVSSGVLDLPFGKMGIGMGMGEGRHGMQGFFGRGDDMPALMDEFAKALGIDTETLMTELRNGKSINAIAQEKSVDVAQLKQTVLTAMKTSLDEAVQNSQITQDQADKIYHSLSDKIDSLMSQTWTEKGPHTRDWDNGGFDS